MIPVATIRLDRVSVGEAGEEIGGGDEGECAENDDVKEKEHDPLAGPWPESHPPAAERRHGDGNCDREPAHLPVGVERHVEGDAS